jgi:Ser/Thr protein kinase RdoA (MazF antagonist)
MMDGSALLAALKVVPELAGEWEVEVVGERTFHAWNFEGSYFVKWITADDRRGWNEVQVNMTLLPGAPIPVPRLVHVHPIGGDSLVFWEWVEGEDLRSAHREKLPQAFRQLGNFHLSQRGDGQVSSPITGKVYTTISAFLDGEVPFLCADLSPAQQVRCSSILSRLSCGYPTTIHGDMHPGNLLAAAEGIVFVDWGYSRRSINLLDLDYVHSMHFQPAETDWWIIQPEEAGDVLAGYFSTCGMLEVNTGQIQQAVMLWSVLWGLYNSKKSADQVAHGVSMHRLEQLLEAQP